MIYDLPLDYYKYECIKCGSKIGEEVLDYDSDIDDEAGSIILWHVECPD